MSNIKEQLLKEINKKYNINSKSIVYIIILDNIYYMVYIIEKNKDNIIKDIEYKKLNKSEVKRYL